MVEATESQKERFRITLLGSELAENVSEPWISTIEWCSQKLTMNVVVALHKKN